MSDLVERLRHPLIATPMERKAADEIERLRAMLHGANAYGAGENAARLKVEAEVERLRSELANATGIIEREAWLETARAEGKPGPYVSFDDYERLRAERDAAFKMTKCECGPDEACANLVKAWAERDAKAMFAARLENMSKNGDVWLSIPAALALMADCDMLAARKEKS